MMKGLKLAEAVVDRGLRALGYTRLVAATTHGDVHVLAAEGSGLLPPVVLLHGLGSRGVDYLPIMQRLRPHTRAVLAPDLLGHGRSSSCDVGHEAIELADTLADALAGVLAEPALVYGNSLGGLLALRFALDRPALAHALYLASPAGAASTAEELAAMRRLLHLGSHRDALRFLDAVLHDPTPLRHLLALAVRRRFAHATPRALLAELNEIPAFREGELASLTLPIRLVWGRGERLLPRSHLAYFRAQLPPHAEIEEAPGFGHSPQLDDASRLAQRIIAFAHTTASAPASARERRV
jgi:pimeloyl-ACP methyl ester carboxylesterase